MVAINQRGTVPLWLTNWGQSLFGYSARLVAGCEKRHRKTAGKGAPTQRLPYRLRVKAHTIMLQDWPVFTDFGGIGMKHQRIAKRVAALFATLSLLALLPTTAIAATWTKKSLKYIGSSDSLSTQIKKSTKIKKTGFYALTMKGGNGIVRFRAPKTKTYKFTFSSLKSSEVNDVACVIGFCRVSGGQASYKNVKTKEGTRPRVPVVSSSLANGKTFKLDGYTYESVKTRYGKIKLKKGQYIYVVIDARDMSNSHVSTKMRMKIS